ncbi:hypothetical protein EGH21_20280 [Halomicroarcula sp. F13]|uniref:Small CPxCG-related zinc finger protein n=1 Tax=Haloarcula rubra TaxID=2487747 RepID=A0AAW4PWF2_9EURY|nr:hypothetical protein [Halomicroarcula rubra]MBX0325368.1 hypothetical protein [Halomicroarcula rubra]
MTVVERLVAYVAFGGSSCPRCGDTSTVVHECCRCGTSVDAHVERCPRCASVDIARYEI